ncbi:MAG: nitroreductase family protein [Dakarella massiliensis]
MEFRETLARRRSSRAYETTPVSDEALDTILAAGRAAPVAWGNTAPCTSRWSPDAKKWRNSGISWHQKATIRCTAPAFIVVSAKPGTVGTLDAGAIIENMLLAAADLGLGTCFIAGCLLGTKDPAKLRSILQIPEGFEVKSGITLGHITPTAFPQRRSRNASAAPVSDQRRLRKNKQECDDECPED